MSTDAIPSCIVYAIVSTYHSTPISPVWSFIIALTLKLSEKQSYHNTVYCQIGMQKHSCNVAQSCIFEEYLYILVTVYFLINQREKSIQGIFCNAIVKNTSTTIR